MNCKECSKLGYTCETCIGLVHSEFGDLTSYGFHTDNSSHYPNEARLTLDFQNKEIETVLTFLSLNAVNVKIDIYEIMYSLNFANLDTNQIMCPYILVGKKKFTLASITRNSI